ncbi:sigma-70 family RNA polymerase sigma factor [Chitinophagaceae bacterium LB-8]|uniref:Sigma-70 family RNA polymerase sigma factor n=1 Tax=Paraflavisolibacter caeni TaxID=2982496 RepID=A0A9X3BH65_9BACT|nr:sigma-70 family RNA polymerase sigma factor [Paraflavisolibacter caeni]MCU7549022.1 sigma-70 family RNA polymerase sigma factor [Paraflavisolibacter caeni]
MKFLRSKLAPVATDEELIAAFKQTNDLQRLGQLYERYMELVYGVCLKYLKDVEGAKDSVMLIFEELIIKLPKHDVTNFKNWLHQLSKNHCLMRMRSEKRFSKANFDPDLMQLEENVHLNGILEKEELLTQLQLCLESLPGKQKTAVELFYLEGKCYQEIAAHTGLEWNKVRSFIQNGRRNLKICMDKQNTATAF